MFLNHNHVSKSEQNYSKLFIKLAIRKELLLKYSRCSLTLRDISLYFLILSSNYGFTVCLSKGYNVSSENLDKLCLYLSSLRMLWTMLSLLSLAYRHLQHSSCIRLKFFTTSSISASLRDVICLEMISLCESFCSIVWLHLKIIA